MEKRITDNIDILRDVLPFNINQELDRLGNLENLQEIVLDLGRLPTARFLDNEAPLSETEVTRDDLDSIIANVGEFDADNRAGMERTLHRISAIRNRKGIVVGLTCRVGRAVYGTIDIIEEFITSGKSVLMLGPPGVGKTTMLREAARVLAESDRRVVIVDTSNEIGGDGDVPHPAIGKARRMQVSHPERQHEVMIEAVENHNPEVIVIDEIGRELEAMAARTIAERGVQLIGTAHGNALDNLMMNPTLSDLIGGIESVTLSDDEARRRGTQKTVLERRAPPTFDVLVEIQTRNRLVLREDVSAAVDGLLRGKSLPVEVRTRDENGEIQVEMTYLDVSTNMHTEREDTGGKNRRRNNRNGNNGNGYHASPATEFVPRTGDGEQLQKLKIYAYGVARNRLQQGARRLHVPLQVVDDLGEADAVVTLKQYYRRRPRLIVDAERRGMSIYVLRANTVSQMENFLIDIFKLEVNPLDPFGEALRETEDAITMVQSGAEYVDLAPQESNIRKQQHDLARQANLASKSYGIEPGRHVRVLRRPA